MSLYYRSKLYRKSLISFLLASLVFLPLIFYIGGKASFIFWTLIFILLTINNIVSAKNARIEIYSTKIKYVNCISESPKNGEILISMVKEIRKTNINTIEVLTDDGHKHDIRTSGMTKEDQQAFERELNQITHYDKTYCLSCHSPIANESNKCPKCGWVWNKQNETT